MAEKKIRVLALGLVRDGDRLFLSQGYDPVMEQHYYRALGGGVDFGETSLEALKREFREEIEAELTNIRYLGCIENLLFLTISQGTKLFSFISAILLILNFIS